MQEKLRQYIAAGLVHRTGSNDSGGLSSRWVTFADGSQARWGYCDNAPYRGAFQSRPDEIAAGSIAEAFLAGEEPCERLMAVRDASASYKKAIVFEEEYNAFLREAKYFRSGGKYRTTNHVLDTGDPLYRAVWRGKEWIVTRCGKDASACHGIEKEVWHPVPPDFQNPSIMFREDVFARTGRETGGAA